MERYAKSIFLVHSDRAKMLLCAAILFKMLTNPSIESSNFINARSTFASLCAYWLITSRSFMCSRVARRVSSVALLALKRPNFSSKASVILDWMDLLRLSSKTLWTCKKGFSIKPLIYEEDKFPITHHQFNLFFFLLTLLSLFRFLGLKFSVESFQFRLADGSFPLQ